MSIIGEVWPVSHACDNRPWHGHTIPTCFNQDVQFPDLVLQLLSHPQSQQLFHLPHLSLTCRLANFVRFLVLQCASVHCLLASMVITPSTHNSWLHLDSQASCMDPVCCRQDVQFNSLTHPNVWHQVCWYYRLNLL